MDNNKALFKKIIWRLLVVILLITVASIFIFEIYRSHVQKNMVFSSRYTFSIDIDSDGNVISDNNNHEKENDTSNTAIDNAYDFSKMSSASVGNIWIKSFLKQFTGIYVPRHKKLTNITINESQTLDENNRTCLISFNANTVSASSEYFSTWNGVLLNGKLNCEWVVTFSLIDHYNNTATIYVTAIQTPEDYGISKYDDSSQHLATSTTVTTTNSDDLSKYSITNDILYVTYNGGTSSIVVPVDIDNLLYDSSASEKTLLKTSYMISSYKTAFVYGGKQSNNKDIPLSVIYSDDKGVSWTTYELNKDIKDASFVYVYFTDASNGFIVVGYNTSADKQTQTSLIYKTSDGGSSWQEMGQTPLNHPIKGVLVTDNSTIFICYYYNENYVSNLYVSYDGGTSFSNIILDDQELDSSAANSGDSTLHWSDVYKDALVPIINDQNVITVYLSQGEDAKYNNGKTAAKYTSSDNGKNWEYIGQLEINIVE